MYGESHNMNSDDGDVVNKTQNFEAVLQYQFDFGLRPSIGYSYSKALDVAGWICPYISRHLLSLNPLQARCRRYSRGER